MPRILVIDDNEDICADIIKLLGDREFKVAIASNGKIGLELAQEFQPDLIISAIEMPELDGYAVLSHIRHDQNLDIVPFVFLAAATDIESLRHGMELGADDYLTLPLVADDLLAVITSKLEKQAIFAHHCYRDMIAREGMEKHELAIAPIDELLTPRQREILRLVAQSKTTKQIAEELFISVKTVETHRGQVMERLDIHDLAGLVRYAIRAGLVDLTENETN